MTDVITSLPQKSESWQMFDTISRTYDRLNFILSIGIDRIWRKKLASFLPIHQPLSILDCATGTADQLLALLKSGRRIHKADGIDLSVEMLKVGQKKIANSPFADKTKLHVSSADKLPFADESYDFVSISFGIRNMPDPIACLKEMLRVTGRGGRICVLEFSLPQNTNLRKLHLFYLRHVLPKIGALFSKNKTAYIYLNQTIETFPYGTGFVELMEEAGLVNCTAYPLTFGIATLYVGHRPL